MTRRAFAPGLFFLASGLLLAASTLHPMSAPNDSRGSHLLLIGSMLVALGALICAGARAPTQPQGEARWDGGLLSLLLGFYALLVLQLVLGVDIGNRTPLLQRVAGVAFAFGGLFGLTYLKHLRVSAGAPAKLGAGPGPTLLGLGFVLGAVVIVKIMGIVGEARPAIDVFDLLQGAAEMVPNGQNPYAVHNAGAAARISGFGHPTPTYPYMPAVWLVTFPFARWLGDARYAYVLTDILAAVLLLAIGRREGVSARLRRYAELSALLVMFHPGSFAKTWIEPLLVPMAFAPVYFALRMRRGARGTGLALLVGFGLSLKQYMLLLAPLFAVWLRGPYRLALGVAAGVSVAIPFILWDARAFWWSVFEFHFTTPFRADTLSIGGFTYQMMGVVPPSWLGLAFIATFVVIGLYFVRIRGFVAVVVWSPVALLWLFAGSGHSHANYYHCVIAYLLAAGLTLAIEQEAPGAFENACFRAVAAPKASPG